MFQSLYVKLYQHLDHTPSDVSNSKRMFAYIIDWYVGSLFMTLPLVFLYSKLTGTTEMTQTLYAFPGNYGYVAGGLALLFGLLYYVFIPLKVWKGQTPGKRMMGFKIVKDDNSDVDFITLFKREVIFIFLFECSMYSASSYFHQILSMLAGYDLVTILMYIGIVITVASGALVLKFDARKMFHDYFAKTRVINVVKDTEGKGVGAL